MNETCKRYDYIFLGTGCATLSIVIRMIDSGKFKDKQILLIDRTPKIINDRTWCFWEKEDGYFENLVFRKWNYLNFKTEVIDIDLEIDPYQYKMIRGIDFYNYCFSKINLQNNISVIYGNISKTEYKEKTRIEINNKFLDTKDAIVFSSIYNKQEETDKYYLQQHFKGWIIETSSKSFDKATLMDFSISQKRGTSFIYVLPISSTRALIEYTLFTKNILAQDEYDKVLKNYIEEMKGILEYTILETEYGVIPMTNANFKYYNNGIYNIGTAGGQTKASTGYTFNFIQKHSYQIVNCLEHSKISLLRESRKKKYHFYDSTLLHILANNRMDGKEIFTNLFFKNRASKVFKFLDNETNVFEDLDIIKSLPKKEFFIAGFKEFIKMFRS